MIYSFAIFFFLTPFMRIMLKEILSLEIGERKTSFELSDSKNEEEPPNSNMLKKEEEETAVATANNKRSSRSKHDIWFSGKWHRFAQA